MGDLRGLIEAVEGGTFLMDARPLDGLEVTAYKAFSGSLDAAKALHEALLPGWWVTLRHSTRPMASVGYLDAVAEGQDDNLARAWLLAILRALESGARHD